MNERVEQATHGFDHDRIYRLVLASLKDYAVFTIDLNMSIVSWNQGARAVFGYTEDEILGQHSRVIFTREDQRTREPFKEIQMAHDTGRSDDERWHVRKDGSRFWGDGVVNPLRNEAGEVIGYVKIVRDLTERHEARQKLQAMADTLEQQVAERTRQVRDMAKRLSQVEHRERRKIADDLHDHLAQLLVSCRMKLSLIEPADDASRQAIEDIQSTLGESLNYTRTLIAELRPTVLFEQGLVAAVHWLADRMWDQFHLTVKVDVENDLDPIPEDVNTVLFHAIRELLMNVIKHSCVNEAEVALHRNSETVQVKVADHGVGFRMETNGRSDTPRDAGGYGLFSVRERIHLIGGQIDVQSMPGQGSEITLRVPLHPNHVPESATQPNTLDGD